VQDVPHDEHVHRRQRILEEAARFEGQALLEPMPGDVTLEHGLHRRQV
jgi:hypothetical protein